MKAISPLLALLVVSSLVVGVAAAGHHARARAHVRSHTHHGNGHRASAVNATARSGGQLSWKAGLSGFPDIETNPTFAQFIPYLSWYSNYNPVAPDLTQNGHTVLGAPMLWGKGDGCPDGPDGPVDQQRFQSFEQNVASGATSPSYFFGFYEPDCNCPSSSNIPDVQTGLDAWRQYIAPLSSRGILLGSPPMCKQLDEDWLTQFVALNGGSVSWDVTSIHVNKPTVDEGIKVVEYYANKFGKPVWVSEFTCVNDQDWSSCGDQGTVNAFIDGMVAYFEQSSAVLAYGANTGEGVPGLWSLFTNGWPQQLTETGQHYLDTLKQLHPQQ